MNKCLNGTAREGFPKKYKWDLSAKRHYMIRVPYSKIDESWWDHVEELHISPPYSNYARNWMFRGPYDTYQRLFPVLEDVTFWRIKWFEKGSAESGNWYIPFTSESNFYRFDLTQFQYLLRNPLRRFSSTFLSNLDFGISTFTPFTYPQTLSKGFPLSVKYRQTLIKQNVLIQYRMNVSQNAEDHCYFTNDHKWMLLVTHSEKRIQSSISRCSDRLRVLDMQDSWINRLNAPDSLDLSKFYLLRTLNVRGINNLKQISGLHQLHHLQTLDIGNTMLGPTLDLKGLTSLRSLNISATPITQILPDKLLSSMTAFSAGNTNLTNFDFLRSFPRLKSLDLVGTLIQCADDLYLSPELEALGLGQTGLKHLPARIRTLKKLSYLDIRSLHLEALPQWLPELGLDFSRDVATNGIILAETTITDVDMSIFFQPRELVVQWFEEWKTKTEGSPLNEIKVVFLGDGEAGKSLTVARLLQNGAHPDHFDSNATPGIAIADREYELDNRRIQVHFWDFGGQEILHSMHRMFLTDRTLYVILLSARDDTQDDRARYWLHNVKSFANGAPVLLVLNKIDQNPTASVNERDLRAMYSSLTEVIKMSALKDTPDLFNANFTAALLRQIQNFKTLQSPFLPSWIQLKSSLQNMTNHYIRGSDYIRLCEECGVANLGQTRKALLKWFHDLGVSFCYEGSQKLEDYVILRPEWITNAIYMIIFNHHPDLENGILSHESIIRLLRLAVENPDSIQRVLPDVTYTPEETEYVLNVIRKFSLSYLVRDGEEFIPMLCERNSKPVADTYADDPQTLEFRMIYDYLPNNVIHRLMVELRHDLSIKNVWRTGALFIQKPMGVSAVVKREDDILRILVQSEESGVSAHRYLDYIRSAIDKINQSLGLRVKENQIVYKENDKTECFNYDVLRGSLASGLNAVFSAALNKPIPIENILNQSSRREDRQKSILLENLASVFQDLQNDKDCWNRDENGLNTLVRNSLRKMGYIVHDQTLCGLGAGEKNSGELDLEIRKDTHIPWTIFEALWVRNHANLNNWDQHLKRLLDNYNPIGLPFLIQVCYVDVPKAKFEGLCEKYLNHLQPNHLTGYTLQSASKLNITPPGYEDNAYIQAAQSVYDLQETGMNPHLTTVYHFFVRLGK